MQLAATAQVTLKDIEQQRAAFAHEVAAHEEQTCWLVALPKGSGGYRPLAQVHTRRHDVDALLRHTILFRDGVRGPARPGQYQACVAVAICQHTVADTVLQAERASWITKAVLWPLLKLRRGRIGRDRMRNASQTPPRRQKGKHRRVGLCPHHIYRPLPKERQRARK